MVLLVGGFVADVVSERLEYLPEREEDQQAGDQDQADGSAPAGKQTSRGQQKKERHEQCEEIALNEPEAEGLLRGHEAQAPGQGQEEQRAVGDLRQPVGQGPSADNEERSKAEQAEKVQTDQELLEHAHIEMDEEYAQPDREEEGITRQLRGAADVRCGPGRRGRQEIRETGQHDR